MHTFVKNNSDKTSIILIKLPFIEDVIIEIKGEDSYRKNRISYFLEQILKPLSKVFLRDNFQGLERIVSLEDHEGMLCISWDNSEGDSILRDFLTNAWQEYENECAVDEKFDVSRTYHVKILNFD